MAPLLTSDLSPTQKLELVVGVTVALMLANWEWWSGKEGEQQQTQTQSTPPVVVLKASAPSLLPYSLPSMSPLLLPQRLALFFWVGLGHRFL